MPPIKILIADDHQLFRTGIRAVLCDLPHVAIVGEAASGFEAVRLADVLTPDIIFMDIRLPELDGLTATRQIKSMHPAIRVIILSSYSHEEYVLQAIGPQGVGADGYIRKEDSQQLLPEAIEAVTQGQTYLTPAVSAHLVAYLQRTGGANINAKLPPKQKQVLIHLASGLTTTEIAIAMDISPKTVETHRLRLMERLGIYDLAGLVRYAVRNGLISAE